MLDDDAASERDRLGSCEGGLLTAWPHDSTCTFVYVFPFGPAENNIHLLLLDCTTT